ncbi:MAG: hypothetical protein NZ656_09690, partial [Nitrospinaceae bacterium]|nr:hypothetical protein [Nitrospinaceae bacterium]
LDYSDTSKLHFDAFTLSHALPDKDPDKISNGDWIYQCFVVGCVVNSYYRTRHRFLLLRHPSVFTHPVKRSVATAIA